MPQFIVFNPNESSLHADHFKKIVIEDGRQFRLATPDDSLDQVKEVCVVSDFSDIRDYISNSHQYVVDLGDEMVLSMRCVRYVHGSAVMLRFPGVQLEIDPNTPIFVKPQGNKKYCK